MLTMMMFFIMILMVEMIMMINILIKAFDLVNRPAQLICISELAVVTPVERGNFVSVVPAAKKPKLDF